MKILADSGSTKTHWAVLTGSGQRYDYYTSGINPSLMSDEEVAHVIGNELLPQLSSIWWVGPVDSVEFYGAGCAGDVPIGRVRKALSDVFKHAQVIVDSDMLGACRALCGDKPGVCAILGTGSNSCLYDGKQIVRNVPSLGFILGDEGGGAYMGKRLAGDILKGLMPDEICAAFNAQYHLAVADVVRHVYREPQPNRFLAQMTYFIADHIGHPAMEVFVLDCFEQFVTRNLLAYFDNCGDDGASDSDGSSAFYASERVVNCVGSVAYVFRSQLEKVLENHDLRLGTLLREPLQV